LGAIIEAFVSIEVVFRITISRLQEIAAVLACPVGSTLTESFNARSV
jgi:hypothetical protein